MSGKARRGVSPFACVAAAGLALVGVAVFLFDAREAAWGQAAKPAVQPSAQPATAAPKSAKVAVRRITESQYRHTARDVFGPDVKINARFEPEKREAGLLAVGSTQLSVTTSGLEQYFALATSISDQVLGEKTRDATVGCKPVDPAKADAACARKLIATYGEKLFRRPLTEAEIAPRVATAAKGATQANDFYKGLKLSLTSLLMAPEFLFRVEQAEPAPSHPDQLRLTGYTKAARLSFLFWDAPPDAELIAAAKSGELHTAAGLQKQVDRLAASPQLEDGARAFFTDMLQFDAFDSLNKDAATYPKFSQAVADSAREQTLRTLADLLVAKKRDYRDIFTSNETFLNRPLAAVYNVPYASSADWAPYSFAPTSERAGILTQVTFLSLFSHPGRSSPTKRGVKMHEIFMCQPTPDPPADVDFSKVQATENGTVRTRLVDHMTNPGCAVCHKASDPVGLTLEHFDGLGQLRTTENGQPIDVSADIRGVKFSGSQGLAQVMHDDPAVPSCLVRNVYAYGVGRKADYKDRPYLDAQTKAFSTAGYQFPHLLAQIATSPEFFNVVLPAGFASTTPAKTASPQTPSKGSP